MRIRPVLVVLAFVLGLTGGVVLAQSAATSFTDVPEDHWAHEAVQWAVANGITQGKSATEFGVNDPLTRGQAVVFLHRALAGKPAPAQTSTSSGSFTGVGNAVAGPVTLEEGRYLVTVTGAAYVYVYSDGAVEDYDNCSVLSAGEQILVVVSESPDHFQCPVGDAWLEVRRTQPNAEWEIRFVRLSRPAR